MNNYRHVWSHELTRKHVGRVECGSGKGIRSLSPYYLNRLRLELVADKTIPEGCTVVASPDPTDPTTFDLWAIFTGQTRTAEKFGFEPWLITVS